MTNNLSLGKVELLDSLGYTTYSISHILDLKPRQVGAYKAALTRERKREEKYEAYAETIEAIDRLPKERATEFREILEERGLELQIRRVEESPRRTVHRIGSHEPRGPWHPNYDRELPPDQLRREVVELLRLGYSNDDIYGKYPEENKFLIRARIAHYTKGTYPENRKV